jgi:hypothetical protein
MSLHVGTFSDKVRTMNQTKSKNLVLSADDARNLHTEIFSLLARIVELTEAQELSAPTIVSLDLDGGGFKTRN